MSTLLAILAWPLKAIATIGRQFVAFRDARKFAAPYLDQNARLLAAQARETKLTEEIRGLKGGIAKMEKWESEKERYELKQFPSGAFVYSLKPSMTAGEPEHCICETCYQRGKKSILQPITNAYGLCLYICGRCHRELPVESDNEAPRVGQSAIDYDPFC